MVLPERVHVVPAATTADVIPLPTAPVDIVEVVDVRNRVVVEAAHPDGSRVHTGKLKVDRHTHSTAAACVPRLPDKSGAIL